MKRKIFAVLLACFMVFFAIGLVACGDNHNYSTSWTHGPDEHWHECTDEGCKFISDRGEHNMVEGICSVCGYKPHNWQSTWSHGPAQHWRECSDPDCEVITDFGEHNLVSGICTVCGYNEADYPPIN